MKHAHPHSKLTAQGLIIVGCCCIALLEQDCSCINPHVEPYSKDDIEKTQAIAIFTAATESPENITTEPLSPPPDDEEDDDDEEPSATTLSTQHTTLPPSPSFQPANSPQPAIPHLCATSTGAEWPLHV